MGAEVVAVSVVSAFWGVVVFILPFVFGRGPNKGVIQTVLVLSGFSCWLFWFLCYVHQMNPLIGPEMEHTTIYAVKYLWEGETDFLNYNNGSFTDSLVETTTDVVQSNAEAVQTTLESVATTLASATP